MHRTNAFIAGESGMGIDSSGEILLHALAAKGLRITASREFPSLIKGGQSAITFSIADQPVRGGSNSYRLGVGMGKSGLLYALDHLLPGGVLVHNLERREQRDSSLPERTEAKNQQLIYLPTRERIDQMGLHTIFENTFMIGAVAHLLDISFDQIKAALHDRYGRKQHLRDANLRCLETGYEHISSPIPHQPQPVKQSPQERIMVDGNSALALGAIHAGMRTYFAYPMSPSSSILSYIAKTANQTGVIVKQAEDEITAIQMNLGSMYAGARSLTATSGGGFDLMSETISLAGMIEVPLVVVVAQRPGPATGLPTRTAQGDLNLAIHAGHGEFARIVLAVSDPTSAYELIQHAFNLAETYQLPVIVLSEKAIAENRQTVTTFEQSTLPIQRSLVTDPDKLKQLQPSDRYKITETGISKRRLPGSTHTTFFCNGDEHHEDGTLDESPQTSKMIAKRVRKLDTIKQHLPDPIIYGPAHADFSFIGWGSTKNVLLDLIDDPIDEQTSINYLHFDYLRPLKTETVLKYISESAHCCIIENNATGQLAQLIQQHVGVSLDNQLLKRNGRAIVREDVTAYMMQHTTK